MKHIDPEFVRTYIAVVEEGSLTLATKVLGKTVGALSYQILQLEAAVGHKLFVRNGRGMALSEYGRQFLPEARFLLQTHDQILDGEKDVSGPSLNKISLQRIIQAKIPITAAPTRKITRFENNLETNLLRNIFSMWQSYRADGKMLSLEDLTESGLISSNKHNAMLVDAEQSELRCVWAADVPAKLFQLDKHGFGVNFYELWKSAKIGESRRRIFSICKDTDVPVFFSGNAAIPWHSNLYSSTIDRFVSTRLDRLLVPVKIKSQSNNHSGILQISEFRDRVALPLPRITNVSEEEKAVSLNFIGNVSVAI